MRGYAVIATALLCAWTLSACGGEPGPHYLGAPAGWKRQSTGNGGNPVWFNPKNPREQYMTTSTTNAYGTLKDVASTVSANAILQHPGAKFVSGIPFPGCPGEAGLQTFSLPPGPGHGKERLQVAFTIWNGKALTSQYEGPVNERPSAQAMHAMLESVCTEPLGNKWPPAPTVRPAGNSTMVPRAHGVTIFMGRPKIHKPAATPAATASP